MDREVVPKCCKSVDWLLNSSRDPLRFIAREKWKSDHEGRECEQVPGLVNLVSLFGGIVISIACQALACMSSPSHLITSPPSITPFLCLALHTTHEVEDEVRATFAHEAEGPCMSE